MAATSSNRKDARRDRDVSRIEFLRPQALIIASNRGPVTFQLAADGQLWAERGTGGVGTLPSKHIVGLPGV